MICKEKLNEIIFVDDEQDELCVECIPEENTIIFCIWNEEDHAAGVFCLDLEDFLKTIKFVHKQFGDGGHA